MKTNPSPDRLTDLVQRARRDTPGPLDTDALLRSLPAVTTARPLFSFLDEFAALFATPRALGACAAVIALCALAGGWQLHADWQDIEPLASLIGGAS